MKEQKDTFERNILSAIRSLKKHLFFLTVFTFLALATAVLYIKFSAKQYFVKSSVLVLTEGTSSAFGASTEVVRAFNFLLQDKKLKNEVFYLQSFPLIRQVVENLDYRVSYYLQEKYVPVRFAFARINIYENAPFLVVPREGSVQPTGVFFHVRIIDENTFQISAYAKSGVQLLDLSTEKVVNFNTGYELNGTFQFGDQVENSKSSFSLVLSPGFHPERHLNRDFLFCFNNFNQLAQQFKSALSIDAREMDSNLAQLRVRVENRQLGFRFLETLIDTYIQNKMDEANFLANQTIDHIDQLLVDVADDLGATERQLQFVRASQRVMSVEEKAQNVYSELQTTRLLRDEVQRRLNQLTELHQYYSQDLDTIGVIAPSSLGINDPILIKLIQDLTTFSAERERLISQDQLRNPRLVQLENSIANTKKIIVDNLGFSISNTRNLIENYNSQINALNREFAALPETQRQLIGIERQFKLNDAVYTMLLERRIQAQIIKASKLPDAKIVEPPTSAGIASPKTSLTLLFAVLLGFGLPAAFFVARDLLVNTIKNKEDVKSLSPVPVISTIARNQSKNTNVVFDVPRSIVSESFHVLRSNLVYFLHGKINRVILVTSSVPGEGKSFLANNLASSFSMTNSKTVLVEFDLRKPTRYADTGQVKKHPGLSSYLIEKASIEEIIIPTRIPGLDVIHSGQVPPNPIELIHSPRTRELILALKSAYDYVILDTPPYGFLSDPFVLMSYSDLNLYVTRAGYTKRNEFLRNIEDITSKGINHTYVVVNDAVDDHRPYARYGKYYVQEKRGKTIVVKT